MNNKLLNSLLIVTFAIIILVYGKNFLLPIVMATFIWFIIREIRSIIRRIGFIKNNVPFSLQTLIAGILLISFIWLSIEIIITNINDLSQNADKYDQNLIKLADAINKKYDIDIDHSLSNLTETVNFSTVFNSTFSVLSGFLSSLAITIVYVIFMFLEEHSSIKKLDALYPDPARKKHMEKLLDNINLSIGKYLSIKTFTSFLTALLSYVALLIIGIDGAPFWAFLIFIMNFIPNIGSLIATAFPTLFALVQYGDPSIVVTVFLVITVIQLIVGNGIEPKLMGNTLNLSPLTVLIALALWGTIWGITGMLLSVPITVVMVIIFAEFAETKPIAIMLSEDGNIKS